MEVYNKNIIVRMKFCVTQFGCAVMTSIILQMIDTICAGIGLFFLINVHKLTIYICNV